MAFIPSPIIYNILSKLPVKSLARFKSLNKLYCSFINDPHFTNAHFKNHSVVHGDLCLILSCIEHQNLNNTTKIHFFTIKDNEHAMIEYSMPVSFDTYHILPSCNGLICFYGLHGSVHVCNPTTKTIVNLPNIDDDLQKFQSCGFGFDGINDTYKVIKFFDPHKIEIFTMVNGSWNKIRYTCSPCFGFQHHQPPVFANGFFYWFSISSSIVSFDIGKETFETISLPQSALNKDKYKLYLVELKGELCMVDMDFEDKKRVDIWIFKSNGEHWVKLGTIVHRSEPIDTTRPVGIKANKKEILLHGFIRGLGHLSCYNMETGGFRPINIKGFTSHDFHVSQHVETLFQVGH
ncbi:hypothetical protein Gogos_021650 [Gossypium gossypioides]|uniref:F-box domain-containing protein n=1 Tax=Gossypium gossypioides TaxID=34282 RepID=A0A7J9D638_GOSGO|nr:hypothetical protein [Gossypium gossypioides]